MERLLTDAFLPVSLDEGFSNFCFRQRTLVYSLGDEGCWIVEMPLVIGDVDGTVKNRDRPGLRK